MKLNESHFRLIHHLVLFPVMDYLDCLELLDDKGGDRAKLSYVSRPLTRNNCLDEQKDGSVTVLEKGRALFSQEVPLISSGSGDTERQRQAEGIAAAKARGVKFGSPPKPVPDNFDQVHRDQRNKKLTLQQAANACAMPVTTFYEKAIQFEKVD